MPRSFSIINHILKSNQKLFSVSDDVLPNRHPETQKFSIRVLPVNNVPPRFLNRSPRVSVSQGGTTPLGQSLLAVTDADTPTSDLLVTLTQAPGVGRIEKNYVGGKVIIREGKHPAHMQNL